MPEQNPDTTFTPCLGEGCDKKVADHRWGRTKAEGWFFSRDGKQAYCPDHLPAWVAEWRRKKNSGASKG